MIPDTFCCIECEQMRLRAHVVHVAILHRPCCRCMVFTHEDIIHSSVCMQLMLDNSQPTVLAAANVYNCCYIDPSQSCAELYLCVLYALRMYVATN